VHETASSDAPAASVSTEEEVSRNLPFNFGALLLHGLLGQTGFRLIQAPTFLPTFVSTLAGNNRAAGFVRAIQSLGQFLSPLLAARTIEHRPKIKGLALLYGSVMRLQFLLLALIALFVPTESALGLVWLVMGIFGLALGMQGVAFQFIISKAVPAVRRGRLMGLRNAASGIVLLFVSGVGGYLVDRYGFPTGYGYTFLTGFVLTAVGLVAFGMVREPESEELRVSTPVFARIRDLPPLLREEPLFRRFLWARLIGGAGRGALPFYILFVGSRMEISGLLLGQLTIAFVVSQSVAALGWGIMADRTGFRAVFVASLFTWLGGTMLLAVPSLWAAYGVFLLVGSGMSGFMLASQNLVLEFGSALDRPFRIATANSASEFVSMLAFLGAALLSDAFPLPVVFVLASLSQVAALLLIRGVLDPRVPTVPQVPFPD
jgi:MFS family permease